MGKIGFQTDGKLRGRRVDLWTGERNDLMVLSITKNEFIQIDKEIKRRWKLEEQNVMKQQ